MIFKLANSFQTDRRAQSMNIQSRQKSIERIELENYKFAKKLFDSQALISKKKLLQEYSVHKQYKKNLIKLPPGGLLTCKNKRRVPRYQGKHGGLPPLGPSGIKRNASDIDFQRVHSQSTNQMEEKNRITQQSIPLSQEETLRTDPHRVSERLAELGEPHQINADTPL